MNNILETDRLHLRPFTLDDAGFILKLLNTPGWLEFIGDRNVRSIADAEKYLTDGPMKSYQINGFGLSAVTLAGTDVPIGSCGLIKREGLPDVDLGFAFLPEFTGKGYASEIAAAVLAYATNELKINRVLAITSLNNTGSINVLKKIGFEFESIIKMPDDDEELNLFSYTVDLS
ncbi:MAG: GNAT family N-acetyltransferase [Thermoanaerobaculia bacterium]|nr:GNAT family N-acetyltransferase [Thermoanaerobaculia bacterium]